MTLERAGHHVTEAKNGEQAIAALSADSMIEVVITDLLMPEMDGIEFIRHLRQSPASKDVVIIAVSASAYDEDQQRSLDAGGDAFVRKPIEADDLFAQLQGHLNLEWIYADSGPRDGVRPGGDTDGVMPMVPPPPDDLAALFELVVIGDVMAIQKRADELDQADDRFEPFAAELRRLANGFQIEGIRELLELHSLQTRKGE